MADKYDDGDENVAVVFDLLVRKDEENHLGTIKKKKDEVSIETSRLVLLNRKPPFDATVSVVRMTLHSSNVLTKENDDDDVITAIDINIDIFETFAKGKDSQKCLSSFETDHCLALLSIPSLEGEGGKDGRDGKDGWTTVVSSFSGAVLRWTHAIYWNRREGKYENETPSDQKQIVPTSIQILLSHFSF